MSEEKKPKKRGRPRIEDQRVILWQLVDTDPIPMGTPVRRKRRAFKPRPWEEVGVSRRVYKRLQEIKRKGIIPEW